MWITRIMNQINDTIKNYHKAKGCAHIFGFTAIHGMSDFIHHIYKIKNK